MSYFINVLKWWLWSKDFKSYFVQLFPPQLFSLWLLFDSLGYIPASGTTNGGKRRIRWTENVWTEKWEEGIKTGIKGLTWENKDTVAQLKAIARSLRKKYKRNNKTKFLNAMCSLDEKTQQLHIFLWAEGLSPFVCQLSVWLVIQLGLLQPLFTNHLKGYADMLG